MAAVKTACRYVWATAGVAALGTAWCVAYLTVGAGTEAFAYIFVPVGGVLCRLGPSHVPQQRP